ncbi:hypothetical protein B0H17DRAFT_1157389 [Mycena rosella]|uniref:Uncharacterized protein n=1 Tax=Mycena rosella TaxID=1033263 RepID=A0AAD7DZL5_MYCRO|nr:hypothetical protein B0H17DRAFT_1157389 [Mycena rosella]
MFVPFLSKPRSLSRRRGGGKSGGSTSAGGKTGSSSSSSSSSAGKSGSGSTGSSSSSKGGSSTPIKSTPIKSGGSGRTITGYNNGGGKVSSIPVGQLFAGRSQGGATRSQVWGTRAYGSGYPGVYTRGVSGRGFPFYFWPLAWGTGLGFGANTAYLHSDEYGQPDNSSRPGGPQATAAFSSNTTGTTFRLVADNATTTFLAAAATANCSSFLAPVPTPALGNASVQPEQVVQYYRASSAALALDGYNNSAVSAPENATADTPLPAGIDTSLLECLNATIGQAVPLVDGARALAVPGAGAGVVALVMLLLRALL